ncbi:MAG: glycosyltransferase [bacterium]|nr:glycosyltransferase [bacterium]
MDAPLVTVFLFAYNQEKYIESACLSILGQTYSPLEIIFSDDCSSDATCSIMEKIFAAYDGPHSVRLNRNETNLGLIGHVNLSARLALGELIVAAAGDDISLPDRVSEIVACYLKCAKKVSSIHSAAWRMAEDGTFLDEMHAPMKDQELSPERVLGALGVLIGATHAWVPKVFEVFGDIECENAFEDLVIAFRSALLDGICYIDKPLVNYRVGGNGLTSGDWSNASREARLRRALRGTATHIDVFEQRRRDSLVVGREDLAGQAVVLIRRLQVLRMVYTNETGLWRILWLGHEAGCLRQVVKALSRRLRGKV